MGRGWMWLMVAVLSGAATAGEARGEAAGVPVRVALSGELGSLAGLRAPLEALPWIEVVEGGRAAALTLMRSSEGLVVRGADGVLLATPVAAEDPAAGARLAQLAIDGAHRVLMGRVASSDAAPDVTFHIEQLGRWGFGGGGDAHVLEPGDAVRWEARNFSTGPAYVHVYAVSPDGGVSLVYPLRGRAKAVEPGEAVDQVVEVSLPDGLASVTDLLLLVATDAPFDPAGLLDPERVPHALASLEAGQWHTARHELRVRRPEIVVAGESPGVEPGASGPPDPEPKRAARRTPRTLRFDAYYTDSPELGAVQSRLAKVSKLCGRGGAACKASRSPLGDGVYEIERTGRRLGEGSVQTVASAFEQAYQMRTGLRAARVVPQLGIEPGGGPAVDAPPPLRAGRLADFRSLYPAARAPQAEADYRRLFGGAELAAVAYLETEVLHHHRFDPEVASAIGAIVAGGADGGAFIAARRALLRRGISGSLRRALEAAEPSR